MISMNAGTKVEFRPFTQGMGVNNRKEKVKTRTAKQNFKGQKQDAVMLGL